MCIRDSGKMAFVMLDDGSASLEVSVFNEVYDAERAKIVVDDALIVEGKVQKDDFTGGYRVVAERLMTLAEARARFAKQLTLRMNGEVRDAGGGAAAAQKLQALMAPYRDGPTPVVLRYRNRDAEAEMRFGESWRVRLDNRLIDDLREWLQPENVEVTYP